MSLRTFALIFALVSAASAVSEHETHFWGLVKPAVNHYLQLDESDENNGHYKSYHVDKDGQPGEHTINIAFQETKDRVELRFFRCKKANVVKSMPVYSAAELKIQAGVLPIFVARMTTTLDQKEYELYFNIIQDIREELKGIATPEERAKLIFEENSAQDVLEKGQVRISLRFAERHLGLFVITPAVVEQVHVLRVDYIVAGTRDQPKHEGSLDVPVLTKMKNALTAALEPVKSILKLKDHINCNEDNMRELGTFAKSFKLITFAREAGGSPTLMPFSLKSGEDVAKGKLGYLPPVEGTNDLGVFTFEMSFNGNPEIDEQFPRMSVKEFHEYLRSLDLSRFFLSLWEKIQIIFKKNMAAEFPESENYEVAYAAGSSSAGFMGMGTPEHSLRITLNKEAFATLSFVDDAKKPRLTFKTEVPSVQAVSLQFVRLEYRPAALAKFFSGFLSLMNDARKSNWHAKKAVKARV